MIYTTYKKNKVISSMGGIARPCMRFRRKPSFVRHSDADDLWRWSTKQLEE